MKNQQIALSKLQNESIIQKLADVFKRIIHLFSHQKVKKVSVYSKLQGAMNLPMPPELVVEKVNEMKTAVEQLQRNNTLSEKKKKRAQKELRRQLIKLIDMDAQVLQSGFNIKRK